MTRRANETEINIEAAYISLMSAIQSYFDTYRTLSHAECSVDFCDVKEKREKQERQINDILEYRCDYFTSITHFQHFFEIVIKGILKIYDEKYKDFPSALQKLKALHKNNLHEDTIKEIEILLENRGTLCVLNKLRNFAWHQGLIKKAYRSYDFFVGYKILPLASKIVDTLKYSSKRRIWAYKKVDSDLDPMDEIYKEFKKQGRNADYERVALLKEMGRAAYHNPLFLNEDENCDEKKYHLHRRVVEMTNRDIMEEYDAKTKTIK